LGLADGGGGGGGGGGAGCACAGSRGGHGAQMDNSGVGKKKRSVEVCKGGIGMR
jgi:hypothetical protein